MARYTGPKEKIERRLGTKLSLKGSRSLSPKSASVKRPYPPGQHGKRFKGKLSEFGSQLKSKQKVRNTYRMLEKQFKNLIKDAMSGKEETGEAIVKRLESRLDNVIYRAGLGQSRDQSRQLVTHGHIMVNGRKARIPSYQVKRGDAISVRPGSLKSPFFSTLVPQWIKDFDAPHWLEVDKSSFNVKVTGLPMVIDSGLEAGDIQSIVEYYSR
jgi:small subunit ribosomal protein S4